MTALYLVLADSEVTIVSSDTEVALFLRALWMSCLVKGPLGSSANLISVAATTEGWEIRATGEDTVLHSDFWNLALHVRAVIAKMASTDVTGAAPIHAAALCKDGACVVLVGSGGSGKTTLAIELARLGWSHVADDLCCLSPEGLVRPAHLPVGIKDPGSWPRFETEWDLPASVPPPSGAFLVPADIFALATGPALATLMVFHNFAPTSSPRITRLSTADCVARAGSQMLRVSADDLSVIARFCGSIPGVEMSYPSTSDALELLRSVVT